MRGKTQSRDRWSRKSWEVRLVGTAGWYGWWVRLVGTAEWEMDSVGKRLCGKNGSWEKRLVGKAAGIDAWVGEGGGEEAEYCCGE